MRRRDLATAVGGATVARAEAANAQPTTKMPRTGFLSTGRSEPPDPTFNVLKALLQGLQDLGYTEGQDLTVERQYADGRPDRLRELVG